MIREHLAHVSMIPKELRKRRLSFEYETPSLDEMRDSAAPSDQVLAYRWEIACRRVDQDDHVRFEHRRAVALADRGSADEERCSEAM